MTTTSYNKPKDSYGGLRFLIVDDHKFSRHIVMETLRSLQATKITEAKDGGEAMEFLQRAAGLENTTLTADIVAKRLALSDEGLLDRGTYDCVITDFNMLPVNGLELLKMIRTGKAQCPRDTPVVMLTGFSDDYLICAALELDVNSFAIKPISRTALNEKLGRVLMRPIEPKSIGHYEKIFIPKIEGEGDKPFKPGSYAGMSSPVTRNSPNPEMQGELKVRTCDVGEIGEDMILAADISAPNGVVLLRSGTHLSKALGEKLRELHEGGWMATSMVKVW